MPTVTAAITLYNRAGYINVLLKSLFDSQDGDIDVRAVVVDNGSSDNSVDVAKSFGDRVRVIENTDNRPLSMATNQALEGALEDEATDYVLILNDDVSLLEGCLRKLVDACREHPHSLLTPLQLQYEEPHDIDNGAYEGIPSMRPLIEDALLKRPLRPYYKTNQLVGAALFASRQAFEHIGRFDEEFRMYGLDTDYNNRALWLGYDLLLVPHAHCLHAHGRFMYSPKADGKAWLRRWQTMLLGRYLLVLKNPKRPLWWNYVASMWLTSQTVTGCARRLWWPGINHSLRTQFYLFARYPNIRAQFRSDYDPAKKLSNNSTATPMIAAESTARIV